MVSPAMTKVEDTGSVASLPENGAIMMLTALERDRRMIAKLLLQNLIWIVVMGALLFVPAVARGQSAPKLGKLR